MTTFQYILLTYVLFTSFFMMISVLGNIILQFLKKLIKFDWQLSKLENLFISFIVGVVIYVLWGYVLIFFKLFNFLENEIREFFSQLKSRNKSCTSADKFFESFTSCLMSKSSSKEITMYIEKLERADRLLRAQANQLSTLGYSETAAALSLGHWLSGIACCEEVFFEVY